MLFRKSALAVVAFLFLLISGCTMRNAVHTYTDTEVISHLKEHIGTLASDQFEGRETGTNGEALSSAYISQQFKKIGLKAMGTKKFLQPFNFNEGANFGEANQLYVNDDKYKFEEDFYPLPYSGNKIVTGYIARVGYGIYAPSLETDDYKTKINITKKIFVIETSDPDSGNVHTRFGDYDLRWRVDYAIARGAAAIIFINSDGTGENPPMDFTRKITPTSVPVIFAKGKAAEVLKSGLVKNCTVGTAIQPIQKTGNNVIGYLDNKAAFTVVIGAHYDHLGYGGSGSLYRGERAIHNGADDNASGTAALIEMARMLSGSKYKKHNYLFIAFSGEEKGLLGSNYFIKHPTIDKKKIAYMLNMDMVGRLDPKEKTLLIFGSGTSSLWKNALDSAAVDGIKISTKESGIGPSDHTSFYLDSIPVLHFFSGTHSDYHKPSDDEPLINYEGEMSIIKTMMKIIVYADNRGKLDFIKTKDESNTDAPRFKVTLGVVPDYAFEGEGMRIDGVSDNKPASKAGLLKGDVVIQLGDHEVKDMTSYMKALGKFNKGEKTQVKFKRGNATMESEITF